MKKLLSLALAVIFCFSFASCGEDPAESVHRQLQGVWEERNDEGLLMFYSFRDDAFEAWVIYEGIGIRNHRTGAYTVGEDRVDCHLDFVAQENEESNMTGAYQFDYYFSDYEVRFSLEYADKSLRVSSESGSEIIKLSSADLMGCIDREEAGGDRTGVACIANILLENYPDSDEAAAAKEKKDAAEAGIKSAGEAALQNFESYYDKVEKVTSYFPKSLPDNRILAVWFAPYIYDYDSGDTRINVDMNYTGRDWIFFDQATLSVDGNNGELYFSGLVSRDTYINGFSVGVYEFTSVNYITPGGTRELKSIINSNEAIFRFSGDKYYDHVITAAEKAAISDAFDLYDYLAYDKWWAPSDSEQEL